MGLEDITQVCDKYTTQINVFPQELPKVLKQGAFDVKNRTTQLSSSPKKQLLYFLVHPSLGSEWLKLVWGLAPSLNLCWASSVSSQAPQPTSAPSNLN